MFSEIDSSNLEQYATGKKAKRKARGKCPSLDYVKVGAKKGNIRKKRSMPKMSVVKM